MRFQEPLAQEELTALNLWKAAVAVAWRRLPARHQCLRLYHLAVVVADRQVFVQSEKDAGVRTMIAHDPDHLDAKIMKVMEMNRRRIDFVEIAAELVQHEREIVLRHEEEIVAVRPVQRLAGVSVGGHERRPAMG
jgi:hypothetical protein